MTRCQVVAWARFIACVVMVSGAELVAAQPTAVYHINFEQDSLESLTRFGPIAEWPSQHFPGIVKEWSIGERSAVGLGASRALIATFTSGESASRAAINLAWSYTSGALPCPTSVSFDLIAVGRSTGFGSPPNPPAGTLTSVPLVVDGGDDVSSQTLDVGPNGTRVSFGPTGGEGLGGVCEVSVAIVSLRHWDPIVVAIDNLEISFDGLHCVWPYGPVFSDGGYRPSEATLVGDYPLDQFGRVKLPGGEPVRFALRRAAFNRQWEVRAWFASNPSEVLYWNRVVVQSVRTSAGQVQHEEVVLSVPQPRRLRDAVTGEFVDTLHVCAVPLENLACAQMSQECASTNSGLVEPAFHVVATQPTSPVPAITVASPPAYPAVGRTCFTLKNIGDAPATVTLTPQHGFYILNTYVVSIPPGESRRIDVTFTETGERESAVVISGEGVPAGLHVSLRLAQAAPSSRSGKRRAVRHPGLCD